MEWSKQMNQGEKNQKNNPTKSEVKLDVTIAEFFLKLSKAARIIITLRFVLLGFSFLAASWLLLGFSDRFWETSVTYRSLLFSIGLSSALWSFFRLTSYFLYYTRQLPWLSKNVRKVYRTKGERLLGIIEIAEEEKLGMGSYSTQIFKAAQEKMALEIKSLQIRKIYPWKRIRIQIASASGILLLTLLAFTLYPEISKNVLNRWAFPFSAIERITLTKILNDNTKIISILENETNSIRFSISPDSRIKPSYAELQNSGESKFRLFSSLNGGIYEFNIPPQNKDFSVDLFVGDYCKTFHLKMNKRPQLETLSSIVKYPEYLSLSTTKFDILNSQIKVPENSEITLFAQTNRKINQVLLTEEKNLLGLNPYSKDFSIKLPQFNNDKTYSLYLMDSFGFSQREPTKVFFKIQKDKPPEINLDPFTDTSPILIFETRKIKFQNEDDFGLSEISLNLSILRNQKKSKEIEVYRIKLPEVGTKSFELEYPFDPSLFDMEDGDEVIFIASTKDNFPVRDATLSKALKMQIIGPEKHADIIRSQIDNIISEISEIARNQEAVQFETLSVEELVRKSSQKELDSKQTKEISNLKNDQNELAIGLNTTAKNGSNILNEASKNSLFDPELLHAFALSIGEIRETSSGSMSESEKQLDSAASSNTSEASQSMMQSAESQERVLEELRRILAKFSEQLDRLEARTLAQRLTKLEKTEKKLSKKLISILPSSVGKMPSKLDNQNSTSFLEMEKIQTQVSEDADEVKNEISRYHERTRKAEYGEVSELMGQVNLKKGLTSVAQNIRNNISFQALDNLNYWESSFEKWAKLLEQKSQEGDFKGESVGGSDRTADILSLLKIRKVQSNILFKTKTLDKEGYQGSKEVWSLSLKDQQDTLMIDLTDTQISIAEEALNPLFDDAHMEMSESSDQLSKQIFDEGTQTAQKESKDIISDLINLLLEAQGQRSGDNENLTAMELLMMQMGNEKVGSAKGNSPLPGKKGGGSSQGGSVKGVSKSLKGSNLAPTKIDSSLKSSSNIIPTIAPEFKEAMEKYFKAVED